METLHSEVSERMRYRLLVNMYKSNAQRERERERELERERVIIKSSIHIRTRIRTVLR